MPTMTRSAWNLAVDHGQDWRTRAACRGDYALFDAETYTEQTHASHVCRRHCPVLDECRTFAATAPRWYGVLAGMTSGWRTPHDPGCGPWCRHLRAADYLEETADVR